MKAERMQPRLAWEGAGSQTGLRLPGVASGAASNGQMDHCACQRGLLPVRWASLTQLKGTVMDRRCVSPPPKFLC